MSEDLWRRAAEAARDGRPASLVVVVAASGSVPGTPGTVMLVLDQDRAGTVGGGIAEHRMAERARPPLPQAEITEFRHESESLCSGVQTFAVMPIRHGDAAALDALTAELGDGGFGRLHLSPHSLAFAPGGQGPATFDPGVGGEWAAAITVGNLEILTLIGGGHVSLAVSRVMATLPFRIRVLDDRAGLDTLAANGWAHERLEVDYREIAGHVPEGERSWVVVMTAGHAADGLVVEKLADHRVRFLGLLGSRAKVEQLFAALEARGVPRTHLERIRAPVGVPIGSHTPEEIAISIAAELVRERNLGRR